MGRIIMTNAVILPVLIPLFTGALLLMLRPSDRNQKWINGLAVLGILASVILVGTEVWEQGTVVLKLGDWEPPFGIVFAVDWLSLYMLFFMNLVAVAVVFYSFFKRLRGRNESSYFDSLIMFQIAGVNGAVCTGDIFNLFVWYEVILIASYGLLAQGGGRDKLKGIPDYLVINIFSSGLFIASLGLTYASFGTLNMAHIGQMVQMGFTPEWSTTLAVMFFLVFGTKSAAFPLYFWLFRAYPLASSAVAALLGGLLTKVGVYSFLRVYPLFFPMEFVSGEVSFLRMLFYLVGTASIVFGLAGALSRHEWKGILSHHITSQIGYMMAAIGLWTPLAFAATLFYVVHNTVVKSVLFLIGGMTEDFTGTTDLEKQSGLIYHIPMIGGLFMIAGLALAGLPPFSGFFAKLSVFYAAIELGGGWAYFVLGVGAGGGLFTLYSMIKIWRLGFMGEVDESAEGTRTVHGGLYLGPGILVVATVGMGLFGGHVFEGAKLAADQVLNQQQYIDSVLEESPVYGLEPGEYQPEPSETKGGHGSGH